MTGLSGSVKRRLNPSAIIEFTATPKPRSNVISAASALELKNAEMIKMPIHLTQHGSWQQAVNAAVMNRAALEQIGRAHVCTPVTNAHLVCGLMLNTKKNPTIPYNP